MAIQERDLERVWDEQYFKEHEGIDETNDYYSRYGIVNSVIPKIVLFGGLYQTIFVIKIQNSSKEYYPWDANATFNPQMLDRIKLLEIKNNKYYGYYVNVDTLQFSSSQCGHIGGSIINNVAVLDPMANSPTILPGQQIFRGFYDSYLKFAQNYVQLLNSVGNVDGNLENNEGIDKCNSATAGGTLILGKLSLDNEIIKNLQFLGKEFSFYDRTPENDDNKFEKSSSGSAIFQYSDANLPSKQSLEHNGYGALISGNQIRIVSPQGDLNIQNAVLGQNLFSWLTNLTIHLEQTNKYLSTLQDYVTDIKMKQENDMNTILNWIQTTFALHGHPQLGVAPNPSIVPTPQNPIPAIEKFDKDNKSVFNILRDKVSTILSKVIGIN